MGRRGHSTDHEAAGSRLWLQAALLCALVLTLYANTLGHGYALDDGVVILDNEHVQRGFGGIDEILTRDAFDSYYRSMGVDANQLPGGRYRPLSIVSFAVEQELFGDGAFVRHLVNVLLYMLCGIAILVFLRRAIFVEQPGAAFAATLLFLVHPIHTEVVANVKSRDELLSMLFLVACLILALRHADRRRTRDLVGSLACFALALLAKEYALALVVLLPLLQFVRRGDSLRRALTRTLPHLAVAAAYLAARFAVVGLNRAESTEILVNPYLYATPLQALATKVAVLGRYLILLVWPHPLSSDYSYAQIPYVGLGHAAVWLSAAAYLALLSGGAWLVLRRNVAGFFVFFFLALLFPVSNLAVNVGAVMGERLAFHASLGLVVLAVWGVAEALRRRPKAIGLRRAALAALLLLLVAGGARTIDRNPDWKNDETLFLSDVETVPDSALANANASLHYLRRADEAVDAAARAEALRAALTHLDRAVAIHPGFANARVNRGLAYFKLDRLDDAEADWTRAAALQPGHPMVRRNLLALAEEHYRRGLDHGSERRFERALEHFERAAALDPEHVGIWTNMGKAHYWLGRYDRARHCWTRALEFDPSAGEARNGLRQLDAANS